MSKKLPLCSSDEIIAVFRRNGFYEGKWKRGSHQSLYEDLPRGRKLTTTVLLGKREVPRPTLQRWLKRVQKSEEQFLQLLKS